MNRIGEAINGCSKFELKRDLVRSYAHLVVLFFSEIWHGCSCFACLLTGWAAGSWRAVAWSWLLPGGRFSLRSIIPP